LVSTRIATKAATQIAIFFTDGVHPRDEPGARPKDRREVKFPAPDEDSMPLPVLSEPA